MVLPNYQTNDNSFSLMQSRWAQILEPFISNPSNNCITLKNVALINGSTTINHLLGRKLQGWRLVRIRAAATIYDNQDNNLTPALTLILVSNAATVVDLEVY